jgi:hypothetical protein
VPVHNIAQKRNPHLLPTPERRRHRPQIQRSTRSRSGFTGVFPHGKNGWGAKISVNGQIHCLGTFPTRELAAAAFSEAAEYRAAANLQRKMEATKRVMDRIKRCNSSRDVSEGKSRG